MQHLETIGIAPLPRRNNNQPLRISSLHQVFFSYIFDTHTLFKPLYKPIPYLKLLLNLSKPVNIPKLYNFLDYL